MSFSTNGDRTGHDVMANLAARLRDRTAGTGTEKPSKAASDASSSASIPRSIPKAFDFSDRTQSPAGWGKENVAASKDADVKMADAPSGPSLFGTEEQLAIARDFAAKATTGASRTISRPARRGRERLLTREVTRYSPSRSSGSAASGTTPRGVIASSPVSYNTGSADPAKTQTRPSFNSSPAPTPFPFTPSNVVKAENQGWKPFSNERTTTKSETVHGNTTNKIERPETVHAHPTSPPSLTNTASALTAKQLTQVTNTLKDRAVGASIPPHLRSKAAAGMPERKIAITPTADTIGHDKGVFGNAESTLEESQKTETVSAPRNNTPKVAQETKDRSIPLSITVSTNGDVFHSASPAKAEAEPAAVNKPPAKKADAVVDDGEGIRALDAVKKELAHVSKRVRALEDEAFKVQKELQALVEKEERRNFLGTNDAKAPFELDVKCQNGVTCRIQAHAGLKVSELIRRIRTKIDVPPAASKDPRILINKTEVGHLMMLDEAGINKGKQVEVVFSHSL